MQKTLFRIDDIGASTKYFNQHGKKHLTLWKRIPFYFPLANFWFFKRLEPFRGWAKYEELTADEWTTFLEIFAQYDIVPIIAVTACWVDEDSHVIPFPDKFPEEANLLKKYFLENKIIIANHGLTHCVVGKHLPLLWGSNRKFHREFLPELDESVHREHIVQSQKILENFFEKPITILVPPGNMWSIKTYRALKGTTINHVTCNRYMADSNEKMDHITFADDRENSFAFHDRELKLYGPDWLIKKIKDYM